MRVVSVNVGAGADLTWEGRTVRSGIVKEPVEGPVRVRTLGLEGDEQVDREVHGGEDKAVYAYPVQHYGWWNALLGRQLPPGTFGENLTLEGPEEADVQIGDRFRVGSAELQVTGPRLPCHKLGMRFGDPGMVKRFLEARRTGYYLKVLAPGEVQAGDAVERSGDGPGGLSVLDVVRLYAFERDDAEMLRRASTHEALPEDWLEHFRAKLEGLG